MAGLDAGKMIGPLPIGAWFAVIAGGLGIAIYTKRQGSPAPTGPVEQWVDTGGQPGVGTGGSGMGWVDVTPPTTGNTAPAPVTNEDWGKAAVNYLIAQGYDPLLSDSAIRKYLGAENMGAQEYALVRVALSKMGSPPVPLPPPLFAPPGLPRPKPSPVPVRPQPRLPIPRLPIPRPAPKPAPKPTPVPTRPNIKYYIVKPGDSLSGIAQRRYKNMKEWSRIYNANKYGTIRADKTKGMIRNPDLIYPGWKLILP